MKSNLEISPQPEWGEEGKDWMRVPLVSGGWCVVDAEDYEKVIGRRWQICQREGWATRVISQSRPTVLLYKIVVSMPRLARMAFIDGNPLNHRKANLRFSSSTVACFNCGLIYRKKASRLIKYKGQFCSNACRNESQIQQVEIACATCGCHFWRAPSQIKEPDANFCSPKCKYKGQERRTHVTCAYCGSSFHCQFSHTKTVKKHFCDTYCRIRFSASDPERLLKLYQSCQQSRNARLIYSPVMIRRFYEWTGNTCAFPGCQESRSDKTLFNEWHLCKLHTRRFYTSRWHATKNYQRRLNELT